MPPQARREAVSSILPRPPAWAATAEPPSLGLERPRAGSISHQPSRARLLGNREAEPLDVRLPPWVDGDDAEHVHACGEAAVVEAQADADRAGTVALGL